jgi:hypothetical protein
MPLISVALETMFIPRTTAVMNVKRYHCHGSKFQIQPLGHPSTLCIKWSNTSPTSLYFGPYRLVVRSSCCGFAIPRRPRFESWYGHSHWFYFFSPSRTLAMRVRCSCPSRLSQGFMSPTDTATLLPVRGSPGKWQAQLIAPSCLRDSNGDGGLGPEPSSLADLRLHIQNLLTIFGPCPVTTIAIVVDGVI